MGTVRRRLQGLADYRQQGSLAGRWRRRRFELFDRLMARVSRPVRILDVGGTEHFWETTGYLERGDVRIVLANLEPAESVHPSVESVRADARAPLDFADGEFDVVFSNSVIEHLGLFRHQQLMARECARVGKRYFVQTPNLLFPVEPHFLLPAFQFWPLRLQVWAVQHFALSWYARRPDLAEAEEFIRSFRLLSRREMEEIFPGANLYRERILGLTKSFVAYHGW